MRVSHCVSKFPALRNYSLLGVLFQVAGSSGEKGRLKPPSCCRGYGRYVPCDHPHTARLVRCFYPAVRVWVPADLVAASSGWGGQYRLCRNSAFHLPPSSLKRLCDCRGVYCRKIKRGHLGRSQSVAIPSLHPIPNVIDQRRYYQRGPNS